MPIDTGQQWVLAGRESELGAAGAALRQGGGVLLTGGSGVGRTRLLAAVLEEAAAAGRTVVTVGGVGGRRGSGGVRAFGSVAECLRWLRQSGGGQRMVLGCDDAHLLDEADAHRVYRTAAAGQLAVAATVRQDARHPVGVDRLWVEQLVERVEVAPFDRTATAAVLRARLGGRLDAGSLERLWSATQGNALVLRELVEHALDDGSLRREREVWSWSGLAGDPPRRLADVLLLWLRDLSAREEELVGMLAVAEPLEADAVARRGLASAAEALSRRGVVRVEQTGRRVRLRLALPLAGRTVVSRMPALTARRLRLQAAEAIEDGERTGPDEVLRTVTLRVAAGRVPERRLLLAAARTAVRRQEFARAEQLCRLVTDEDREGGEDRGGGEERGAGRTAAGGDGEVALLLGQVLAGQGRHEEAEEVFASVRGRPGGAAGRAEAVAARVANIAFGLGRVETAAAVLEEERDRLGAADAGSLLTARAVLAVLADRLPEAVAAGEAVVGLGGPGPASAGGDGGRVRAGGGAGRASAGGDGAVVAGEAVVGLGGPGPASAGGGAGRVPAGGDGAVVAGEAVVGLGGPGPAPIGGGGGAAPAGRGEGAAGGPVGWSGGTEAGGGAGVAGLLPVVAFARAELGDPGGASALLASWARQAEAWPEEALLDFRSAAAHCALVQGDLRAAGTAVARLVRGAAGAGRLGQLRAWVYQARLLRRRGRPEDAAALLWQAGAVRAGYDWLTSPSWVLALLAGALAEAGRHGEALRTLAEARSAQRAGVRRPVLDDAIGFERAVVLAHAGDRSGAAAQALEVADRAEAGGRLPAAIAALHLAARATDAAPSAARVQRLALRCRAEEARLQAEQVRALARGDAEALVAVAGRFRSLAALPAAAEAAEQAGRVHRAAGRRRKGRLASAAAQELCARFGGALPPWAEPGERGTDATAALTTREREVAALAAGGLSNREIADRLVVSVRTVENHLHRVYHKLGVVQRAALSELLVTRPVPEGGDAGAVGAGRTATAQTGRAARPRPRPAGGEERGRCAMCAQPLGSAG
ncbi:LuxR C-terminal-related transcriptional regulator [Streptomyces albogriseolus]|uniref:helix-turn-helix transcriptional regulator n=1 Tax=Streptomyces albogriseolus TaxID=1887 RepID=UPI0036B63B0C